MLNRGMHNGQCLPLWKQSGPTLGLYVGQVGPMLSYVGLVLGPLLGYVGPMLAYVGPMLAHVEPSWELCWGPCLGHLCWDDLKMPIVPPRAPCYTQNHVKTEVLYRRARNTVKKNVLTPQAKYTVNYRGFSWHVVVSGVGRRQGWQRL